MDHLIKKRSDHGGNIYEGDDQDLLDCSSNINPEALPLQVYEALPKILDQARAYPDVEYQKLRKAISDYLSRQAEVSISRDWIQPGNGAVEILDRAISIQPQVTIVQPCFNEYELSALRHGVPYRVYKRSVEGATILGEDFFKALEEEVTAGAVVLCNPNNPDGKRLDIPAFAQFLARLQAKGQRVILDETFGEYLQADQRGLPLVADFPNLIVVKALTKFFGLPGLRLGYGICRDLEVIKQLQSRLTTWNVGTFEEQLAMILFQQEEYIDRSQRNNRLHREHLIKNLESMPIFDRIYESHGNFIMTRSQRWDLAEKLRRNQVLIRDLRDLVGPGYYRIAVKRPQDTDRLIKALSTLE